MNKKEFEALLSKPANKRYEYFIKKIAEKEELWGLYEDGWAMSEDDDGGLLIPFWPLKEYAEHCAINEWKSYNARRIALNVFIEKWLPKMKKDGLKVSIFSNGVDAVNIDTDIVLNHLKDELENI